jgi:hypothetical protein
VSRSGGGSVVLVDEAAEAVAARDLAGGWHRRWLSRVGWLELERAVRPVDVVVVDVDAQDTVEVAAVEDQQSVEAFSADGSDEPPGDGGLLAASARAS